MKRLVAKPDTGMPEKPETLDKDEKKKPKSPTKTTDQRSSVTCIDSTSALWLLGIIIICVILTALNVFELHRMHRGDRTALHDLVAEIRNKEQQEQVPQSRLKPTFTVYGRRADTSHLKHVFAVLKRLGFEHVGNETDNWDLLWAHDYPFRTMYAKLKNLKPHQKVNHFPGSGYITNKVDLATSKLSHIPIAFKIPTDNERLLQYAKLNPNMQFVQKSNDHRGINILKVEDLDLKNDGTFVQEYIANPLLIDGYKFDIGIYTILTSIDPLRLYIYNGEVLFRFCPEKYHPFDPDVLNKYVIGDDYLPTWEVPSLQKYYVQLGFSMKESFNAYIRSKGKNPNQVWDQVEEAIRNIYLNKEDLLIESSSHYKSKTNFFEMVRIDFVVDEDLNVFVMEANMSPNLSSAHFPPNRLLYEQVLFNILGLVGIGRKVHAESLQPSLKEEESMQVAEKNIMVYPGMCVKQKCHHCMAPECQLCKQCTTPETVEMLKAAYLEHVNRHDCKRVFPPPMIPHAANATKNLEDYSPENQLIIRWFQGKCLLDQSWCF